MIDNLDLEMLDNRDPQELARLRQAVGQVGFLKVRNTGLTRERIQNVIAAYYDFFRLPEQDKRAVDMAVTGSNRGWGAPQSEQVDPTANPDFKEVFDCGYELPQDNPYRAQNLSVYAPNLWPEEPEHFQDTIRAYYADACDVSMRVLRAIAVALGRDAAVLMRPSTRQWPCCAGTTIPSGLSGPETKTSALARIPITAV